MNLPCMLQKYSWGYSSTQLSKISCWKQTPSCEIMCWQAAGSRWSDCSVYHNQFCTLTRYTVGQAGQCERFVLVCLPLLQDGDGWLAEKAQWNQSSASRNRCLVFQNWLLSFSMWSSPGLALHIFCGSLFFLDLFVFVVAGLKSIRPGLRV